MFEWFGCWVLGCGFRFSLIFVFFCYEGGGCLFVVLWVGVVLYVVGGICLFGLG